MLGGIRGMRAALGMIRMMQAKTGILLCKLQNLWQCQWEDTVATKGQSAKQGLIRFWQVFGCRFDPNDKMIIPNK